MILIIITLITIGCVPSSKMYSIIDTVNGTYTLTTSEAALWRTETKREEDNEEATLYLFNVIPIKLNEQEGE